MGNQLSSSSSSGRSGKLVLAAGTGIAAAALAWKCHGFLRRSKDEKEMRKKLDDSSQKTVPAFADFCALVVVMGTWRLWSLNDLSKISATGTNREQFTDMQSLPNQSMATSIDSNSATGISQLQDLLDTLTHTVQDLDHSDQEAYNTWLKKDRSTARYTLLSWMQNDLIGEFENFPTTKELWDHLHFKYGDTSETRLRALTLRFSRYVMDPEHTMAEHLCVMSYMIQEMKAAGNELSEKQQFIVVLRSFPEHLWGQVKLMLEHNEEIKTSDDLSRYLELEAECEEANYGAVLVAHADNGIGSMDCNNKQAEQQNQDAEPKGTKRRRGKRGAKKNKSKLECYSCGEKEYFTQECELKESNKTYNKRHGWIHRLSSDSNKKSCLDYDEWSPRKCSWS